MLEPPAVVPGNGGTQRAYARQGHRTEYHSGPGPNRGVTHGLRPTEDNYVTVHSADPTAASNGAGSADVDRAYRTLRLPMRSGTTRPSRCSGFAFRRTGDIVAIHASIRCNLCLISKERGMTMIRGFPGKSGEQNRFIAGSVAPDGIDRRKMLGSACACGLAALLDLKSATTLAADTVAGPARFIHAKLDATAQAIESKMIAWRRHRVSCYGQKRDTPFRQGVLAARENPMNDARKLGLEWQFVVAVVTAIILAAAGAGTIYALVHRPVAGSHPPVVESVAAPSLAAPEVSRPLTPDPPVAAQQPTEPQEVNRLRKRLISRAGACGLQPMCQRPRLGRSTMRKRGNSLH